MHPTRRLPIRTSTAFTLVELLVVIGIIALLISILMPALQKARYASKVTVCASNQRQIYNAVAMYANDNKGQLPETNAKNWNSAADHYNTGFSVNIGGAWVGRPWAMAQLMMGRYLTPSRIAECPDYFTNDGSDISRNGEWHLPDWYQRNVDTPNSAWYRGSYVLNTIPFYMAPHGGKIHGKGVNGGYHDGGWYPQGPITAMIICHTAEGRNWQAWDAVTIAHLKKGVNVTYRDGHVVWLAMDEATWKRFPAAEFPGGSNDYTRGNRGFFPWASAME